MKRIVSLVLSMLMVFTMLPVRIAAEEIFDEGNVAETATSEPVEIATSEAFAAMESDGNYV